MAPRLILKKWEQPRSPRRLDLHPCLHKLVEFVFVFKVPITMSNLLFEPLLRTLFLRFALKG